MPVGRNGSPFLTVSGMESLPKRNSGGDSLPPRVNVQSKMEHSPLVTSDFYSYVVYICIPFMTFLSLFALYQRLTQPVCFPATPTHSLSQKVVANPQQVPRKKLGPSEVKKWQKRVSQLDSFTNVNQDRSSIMQSDYRGLINLSLISLFIFVWSHQVRHFLKEGTLNYQTIFS